MSRCKVVLFDFDGVIGKTMEDNARAWEYAFSMYKIRFDKNEYFLFEGLNTQKVVEHFAGGFIGISIDEIVNLKEKYYIEHNEFSLYEGVASLLCGLKERGYLLGLVTAANYIRLERTLGNEFLKVFNIVITGDRVTNCKPHPEPYLSAAKVLTVRPSDCVVVENAPLGIQSAKSAGMYCIAVASTLDKKHLQDADKVIDKIEDMQELI